MKVAPQRGFGLAAAGLGFEHDNLTERLVGHCGLGAVGRGRIEYLAKIWRCLLEPLTVRLRIEADLAHRCRCQFTAAGEAISITQIREWEKSSVRTQPVGQLDEAGEVVRKARRIGKWRAPLDECLGNEPLEGGADARQLFGGVIVTFPRPMNPGVEPVGCVGDRPSMVRNAGA